MDSANRGGITTTVPLEALKLLHVEHLCKCLVAEAKGGKVTDVAAVSADWSD